MFLDKFNETFPKEFRERTIESMMTSLKKFDFENSQISPNYMNYFGSVGSYAKVVPHIDVERLDDLYAPNYAVLEYYMENKPDGAVLDFGCGLGVMIYYLHHIGIDCYGI